MLYILAIAAGVILDQVVKFWTVSHLDLHETAPLLPGIVDLMYVQNTGGGFSILVGYTWLLTLLTVVLMSAIVLILVKKIFSHPLAMWSLTLVLSGGIGNLIDRVRLGYVVDMFHFQFIEYPVFNVADILVVVGTIAFAAYYLLLDEKIQKKKGEEPREDEQITLQAGSDHVGQRLDAFLAAALEDMTRSAVQRLIEEGRVTVNGTVAAKSCKLTGTELISVCLPEPEAVEAVPQQIPLDVVYEDEDVIVVNKPVGLVVHPAPGHPDGTLVNALLYHCGSSLSGIGGQLRPGIVHRIDRDTSGLIIAAKNDFAHQSLAAQLQDHSLARTYEAVVIGTLREDSGTVDAPIGRHHTDRKKMAVTDRGGRSAVTHWQVLERYRGFTYICCRLETGRTHQIRVHMAHIGHPIYGDTVYGAKKPAPGMTGQCLHAVGLRFTHPRTGQVVEVRCPLNDEFTTLLKKLRSCN